MDDTPDFAATSQTVRPSASIPYNNRERETMPFVRWQLPSRMPREVMNFDRTMEELMEQKRFPAMENSTPRYPYHDEEHRSYQRDSSVERPRSSASRQRSETLPRVNSERDRGAVGTAALQNRPSRPKTRQPPSRGDADVKPEEWMISLITIDYFPLSLGLEVGLGPKDLRCTLVNRDMITGHKSKT